MSVIGKASWSLGGGALLFFALMVAFRGGEAAKPDYFSLVDLDLNRASTAVFATASAGKRILQYDSLTAELQAQFNLPKKPSGSALSEDGKTLYVTIGTAQGELVSLDVASGKIKQKLELGHSPAAPVLASGSDKLYVCLRFNNRVVEVDLKNNRVTRQFQVSREPVAAELSAGGRFLFVANHIPAGRADQDYVAAKVSAIDLVSGEVRAIPLVNGAEGVRDIRLSPDGKYLFATHFLARFLVPTTQLKRGWVSTHALSIIRVADLSLMHTVLLDDLNLGFAQPWAIDFSEDGEQLVVSAAASNELMIIQLPTLMEKVEEAIENYSQPAHLNAHNHLGFVSEFAERIQLTGVGPRALKIVGNKVWVAHYFSDTIEILNLTSTGSDGEVVQLNPQMSLSQERQGEIYFHDATQTFQQWLSCATCHPDGRTDALNWDLLNDGIGNSKNVKSLLQVNATPPTTWLGVRSGSMVSIRSGFKHIQFSNRSEEDSLAVHAYLRALKPTPSPYLVEGALSESAQRGEQIFSAQGCRRCHTGPLFTDLKQHRVGTAIGVDYGRAIDTPSLIELWRTAPYLHDGRAATVKDLLTNYPHANLEHRLGQLDDQGIDDLANYLLSL